MSDLYGSDLYEEGRMGDIWDLFPPTAIARAVGVMPPAALSDGPSKSAGSSGSAPPLPPPAVPSFPAGSWSQQPALVKEYAKKLRTLGYAAPDTTNQRDPVLMGVVRTFQGDAGGTAGAVDGLLGPQTAAAIDARMPLSSSPLAAMVPSASGAGRTALYVGLGVLALGAAALGVRAAKKRKAKGKR